MHRYTREKAPIPISSARSGIKPALESLAAQPDALRDAVYKALSSRSIDERAAFRQQLLAQMRDAGLRVRPCLFLLGASAATAEELTVPEIASLVRYVAFVEPNVMTAVAVTLGELFTMADICAEVSRAA